MEEETEETPVGEVIENTEEQVSDNSVLEGEQTEEKNTKKNTNSGGTFFDDDTLGTQVRALFSVIDMLWLTLLVSVLKPIGFAKVYEKVSDRIELRFKQISGFIGKSRDDVAHTLFVKHGVSGPFKAVGEKLSEKIHPALGRPIEVIGKGLGMLLTPLSFLAKEVFVKPEEERKAAEAREKEKLEKEKAKVQQGGEGNEVNTKAKGGKDIVSNSEGNAQKTGRSGAITKKKDSLISVLPTDVNMENAASLPQDKKIDQDSKPQRSRF